jgi:hypothetical protein
VLTERCARTVLQQFEQLFDFHRGELSEGGTDWDQLHELGINRTAVAKLRCSREQVGRGEKPSNVSDFPSMMTAEPSRNASHHRFIVPLAPIDPLPAEFGAIAARRRAAEVVVYAPASDRGPDQEKEGAPLRPGPSPIPDRMMSAEGPHHQPAKLTGRGGEPMIERFIE